jgi:hypothetical protein
MQRVFALVVLVVFEADGLEFIVQTFSAARAFEGRQGQYRVPLATLAHRHGVGDAHRARTRAKTDVVAVFLELPSHGIAGSLEYIDAVAAQAEYGPLGVVFARKYEVERQILKIDFFIAQRYAQCSQQPDGGVAVIDEPGRFGFF